MEKEEKNCMKEDGLEVAVVTVMSVNTSMALMEE
jgi:hypothetical protein